METRMGIKTTVNPESITVSGDIQVVDILASVYPPGLFDQSIWPGSSVSPEQCYNFTLQYAVHDVLIKSNIFNNSTDAGDYLFDTYFTLYYTPKTSGVSGQTTQLLKDPYGSETIISKSITTFANSASSTPRDSTQLSDFHAYTQMIVSLPHDQNILDNSLDNSFETDYTVCMIVDKDSTVDNTFTITNNLTQIFVLALPSQNHYDSMLMAFNTDTQSNSGGTYKQFNFYEDFLLNNQDQSFLDSSSFAYEVPFFTKDSVVLNNGTDFVGISAIDDYLAFNKASYDNNSFDLATLTATSISAGKKIARTIYYQQDTSLTADGLLLGVASNAEFKSTTLNEVTTYSLESSSGTITMPAGAIFGDENYLYVDTNGVFLDGLEDNYSSIFELATEGDLYYTGDFTGNNAKVVYFQAGTKLDSYMEDGLSSTSDTTGTKSKYKLRDNLDDTSTSDTNTYKVILQSLQKEYLKFEDIQEIDQSVGDWDDNILWDIYVFASYSMYISGDTDYNTNQKILAALRFDSYNGITKVNGTSCENVSGQAVCSTNYLEYADDNRSNAIRTNGNYFQNYDIMFKVSNAPADTFDLNFLTNINTQSTSGSSYIHSLGGFLIAFPTYQW